MKIQRLLEADLSLQKKTIGEYSILTEKICNFHQTCFQIDLIFASVVATATDEGKPKQTKPTKIELIALSQVASADDSSILPFIVFEEKEFKKKHSQQGLTPTQVFVIHPNG